MISSISNQLPLNIKKGAAIAAPINEISLIDNLKIQLSIIKFK